jgi:hypothetical protein
MLRYNHRVDIGFRAIKFFFGEDEREDIEMVKGLGHISKYIRGKGVKG